MLPFLVRLACVKRAASVDSEPGSNSRLNSLHFSDNLLAISGYTNRSQLPVSKKFEFDSDPLTDPVVSVLTQKSLTK